MSDAPAESCEVCGDSPVEKILFPVAVHFKGSGFYNTDYGKSRKPSGDGDGGGPSDTSDKKEKTADSGGSPDKEKKSSSSDSGSSSSSSSSGSSGGAPSQD